MRKCIRCNCNMIENLRKQQAQFVMDLKKILDK